MKEKEQETAYECEQEILAKREERRENYGDGLLLSFLDYFNATDNK